MLNAVGHRAQQVLHVLQERVQKTVMKHSNIVTCLTEMMETVLSIGFAKQRNGA